MIEIQIQQIEKTLDLLFGQRMTALVGAGEVAEQVELGDLLGVFQPRMPLTQAGGVETKAMHAGVELEPDVERARQLSGNHRLGLRRALHYQIQTQLRGNGVFSRFEAAL